VGAVRIVARGEAMLAPTVTRAVLEEFARREPPKQRPAPPALAELTAREREVLELLLRGLSNPEICAELFISDATAKTHVARILQKLGVADRVHAVIWAYENGVITPGSARYRRVPEASRPLRYPRRALRTRRSWRVRARGRSPSRGCSSMVEPQPSKLAMPVRSRSPAPRTDRQTSRLLSRSRALAEVAGMPTSEVPACAEAGGGRRHRFRAPTPAFPGHGRSD
jgi:DNA-binding CsgD family transcriptional regulator